MNIIAHRGYWLLPEEKNTLVAFDRALENNFGIETDVREYRGQLVLSHDIADEASISFDELLEIYVDKASQSVLALNVKEDGIQNMVQDLLTRRRVLNYFFFDMSVPEMVIYRKKNMPYFTRNSDIEHDPVLLEDAAGVWIDAFYDNWDMIKSIKKYLNQGKSVSLISPEIHGKNKKGLWDELKKEEINNYDSFHLCTDQPAEARSYFMEGNEL